MLAAGWSEVQTGSGGTRMVASDMRVQVKNHPVVTIGRVQHVQCPPGTVKVTWDHGQSQNYRVGYGGQYDLRLLDNGTSGVQHSISSCSQCGAAPIFDLNESRPRHPAPIVISPANFKFGSDHRFNDNL